MPPPPAKQHYTSEAAIESADVDETSRERDRRLLKKSKFQQRAYKLVWGGLNSQITRRLVFNGPKNYENYADRVKEYAPALYKIDAYEKFDLAHSVKMVRKYVCALERWDAGMQGMAGYQDRREWFTGRNRLGMVRERRKEAERVLRERRGIKLK